MAFDGVHTFRLPAAASGGFEDILANADYQQDETAARNADCCGVIFCRIFREREAPTTTLTLRARLLVCLRLLRADMSRAVMEGVAFALRDCLEVARQNGVVVQSTNLCGGGAKSEA